MSFTFELDQHSKLAFLYSNSMALHSRQGRLHRFSTQPLFAFAHLAFWAAAILARPSALIFLRAGFDTAVSFELTGRPRFAGEPTWPFNGARAFSSRWSRLKPRFPPIHRKAGGTGLHFWSPMADTVQDALTCVGLCRNRA
jgi:hypothetical protein